MEGGEWWWRSLHSLGIKSARRWLAAAASFLGLRSTPLAQPHAFCSKKEDDSGVQMGADGLCREMRQDADLETKKKEGRRQRKYGQTRANGTTAPHHHHHRLQQYEAGFVFFRAGNGFLFVSSPFVSSHPSHLPLSPIIEADEHRRQPQTTT